MFVLGPLLASVLLGGCAAIFREKVVDAEFPLAGKRVIVIPFSRDRLWYYEHSMGIELGKALRIALRQNGDGIEVVGGPEVEVEVRQSLDDVDWAYIAKLVDADYVLTGNIDEMVNEDNKMVAMLSGHMVVSIEIWDGETGAPVYGKTLVAQHQESEAVDIEFGTNSKRLRAKLFGETCTQICNVLCGYVTDNYPK